MKKPKLPKNADFSQLARAVVEAATSETDDPPETEAKQRSRKGGLKGGKSRAAKLSAERRAAIARRAARERWKKRQDGSQIDH